MYGALHCIKLVSVEFSMIDKNMDSHEENYDDGEGAMENQNNGKLIQDHAEQTGGEGDHDQRKQQPTFHAQFFPINNCVYDTQQQKQHRCHFMNMDAGKRDHDSHDETDQQCDVE